MSSWRSKTTRYSPLDINSYQLYNAVGTHTGRWELSGSVLFHWVGLRLSDSNSLKSTPCEMNSPHAGIPPLFKDLTCDLFPWVLLEKPLILNYWYFLPCRRTSVLSAASLFLTLLSGKEVIVGLVWVFYREPRVSVTPFCEASCLQRAGPLIRSQPEEAQKTRLCLIGRCLGVLSTTVSGWVICVILQFTVRSP